MKVRKALITAAGFGTRFLPITKTVQKEMLPLLDRPIIDYVVDDLIGAGVTEIIFVISEHNKQLLHYYRENRRLYHYLEKHNKLALYDQVQAIHQKAIFHFIVQPDTAEYGTAVPLKLAESLLKDEEAFFVYMGDDFLYHPDGHSESKQMLTLMESTGVSAVATCVKKPKADLHRYGVIRSKSEQDTLLLEEIVEKPAPGTEPSDLVNISKYLFTPKVFEILQSQTVNQASGELYITDTLTSLATQDRVAIHIPNGTYLDGGNPLEWLKANVTVALSDQNLKKPFADFLKQQLEN